MASESLMTTVVTPARKAFKQLLIAIAVLHTGAIGLYYALGVRAMTPERQRYFAWTWIGVTVIVIFAGLQRIRRARLRR